MLNVATKRACSIVVVSLYWQVFTQISAGSASQYPALLNRRPWFEYFQPFQLNFCGTKVFCMKQWNGQPYITGQLKFIVTLHCPPSSSYIQGGYLEVSPAIEGYGKIWKLASCGDVWLVQPKKHVCELHLKRQFWSETTHKGLCSEHNQMSRLSLHGMVDIEPLYCITSVTSFLPCNLPISSGNQVGHITAPIGTRILHLVIGAWLDISEMLTIQQ